MLAAVAQYRLVRGQAADPTDGAGDLGAFRAIVDVPASWDSTGVAIGIGGESANAFAGVVERNVQRPVEAAQKLLKQGFLLFGFRNYRRTGHLRRRDSLGRRSLWRRGNDCGGRRRSLLLGQ